MGVIMKNGISYGGGSGGSGTVADTSHIELTFAEYKELEANGKVDPKATYFITDEDMNGNNNVDNLVELTQEEYDELGDVVNSDNKTYYITDSEEELDASMITFDDTETQMGVSDVQGAIVEQNKKFDQKVIGKFNCPTKYISKTTLIKYLSDMEDGEARFFSFSDVTGMPTITSGMAIAIKTKLSSTAYVIAFNGSVIEQARITVN